MNANLNSYDSPTQLVVDRYMKEHGLEVEPDDEEYGYGKLIIDYKPPKKSTSKISNKGKILIPVQHPGAGFAKPSEVKMCPKHCLFKIAFCWH